MSAGNENTGFAVVLFSHVRESESNWRAKQLRQSLRTDRRKPIIPVVLPGGEKAFRSSRLADFSSIDLDPNGGPIALQLAPAIQRLETSRIDTSASDGVPSVTS